MSSGPIVASPARRLNHLADRELTRHIILSLIAAFAKLERDEDIRKVSYFAG
jgi:hypothetical protein